MKRAHIVPSIVFVGACACGSEMQAAPPTRRAPPPGPSSPLSSLPLPDTAFRCDGCEDVPRAEPSAASSRPPSRFDTRRIGDDAPRGSRFHGAPVDLDLKGADLADVFRLLADVGKVNIVVAGEVTGTVTLKLRRVPWDQALDVVARAKGLALEREGNVILVRAAK